MSIFQLMEVEDDLWTLEEILFINHSLFAGEEFTTLRPFISKSYPLSPFTYKYKRKQLHNAFHNSNTPIIIQLIQFVMVFSLVLQTIAVYKVLSG